MIKVTVPKGLLEAVTAFSKLPLTKQERKAARFAHMCGMGTKRFSDVIKRIRENK